MSNIVTSHNDRAIPTTLRTEGRAQSTLSIQGVLEQSQQHYGGNSLSSKDQDQEEREAVENFIKGLDHDGDGKISSKELFVALGGFYRDVTRVSEEKLRAEKKIVLFKKAFVGMTAVMVLLVGTVFGTSVAAAYFAKDTKVSNRALLTKEGDPVATNVNQIDLPLAVLPFMPPSVASKVHEVTLSDEEGIEYHRFTKAIDIFPGKSVTLSTTSGDTVSWDAAEESKHTVKIQLANGKAWTKSSACTACTAMSVLPDDSVVTALDKFHASIGILEDKAQRRLGNAVRIMKGTEPSGYDRRLSECLRVGKRRSLI